MGENTQEHVCGRCGDRFDSEEGYCEHDCKGSPDEE